MNEVLARENQRLRSMLQTAESRMRTAAVAVESFQEHLLQVAEDLQARDVEVLMRRLDAILKLLRGREGGDQ
jgi:hypothetical protein